MTIYVWVIVRYHLPSYRTSCFFSITQEAVLGMVEVYTSAARNWEGVHIYCICSCLRECWKVVVMQTTLWKKGLKASKCCDGLLTPGSTPSGKWDWFVAVRCKRPSLHGRVKLLILRRVTAIWVLSGNTLGSYADVCRFPPIFPVV